MKIVVTGDRNWQGAIYYRRVRDALGTLPHGAQVIVGDAKGVDAMVVKACKELSIPCRVVKAEWDKYGRGAGPRRNKSMLEDLDPASEDEVWYFHDDLLNNSKGTRNCVSQARERDLTVRSK